MNKWIGLKDVFVIFIYIRQMSIVSIQIKVCVPHQMALVLRKRSKTHPCNLRFFQLECLCLSASTAWIVSRWNQPFVSTTTDGIFQNGSAPKTCRNWPNRHVHRRRFEAERGWRSWHIGKLLAAASIAVLESCDSGQASFVATKLDKCLRKM